MSRKIELLNRFGPGNRVDEHFHESGEQPRLETRDQPSGIPFYDLLVSSFQAPPAEVSERDGHIEVESWSWGESDDPSR